MSGSLPLVFSVTSGKGGVGKTNLSVNLACCLVQLGKRVIIIDSDLGLANVDVVLGLTPQKNLFHLFHEDASLSDILFPTPYGFAILPASSGMSEMLTLSTGQKLELLYFNMAVQERLVVMTPEPTSLTDAYALIKVLKMNHGVERFQVCVNMANDNKSAKTSFSRLYQACDHFLEGVSLDLAGIVPRDNSVRQAVINQKPFCVTAPDSPAARSVQALAGQIASWQVPEMLDGNIKFFWKKLLFH